MSGLIPEGFLFSQHSLNTFAKCERRFLLRYVDRQPWPVPEGEDPLAYEAHLERGRIFHAWVARDRLGVAPDAIVTASDDPLLQSWWSAYRQGAPQDLPNGLVWVELPIVVPLGPYRLYARYDLLALEPAGDAVIVDWKTLETRPSPRVLHQRIQTRVYLYTLVAAGSVLSGGAPVDPARVQMRYWFTYFPQEPEEIAYSQRAFAQDERQLSALVERMAALPREAFRLAEDQRLCAHCNYRTLCFPEAEWSGGDLEAWLDEDLDLDLDSVPEVVF